MKIQQAKLNNYFDTPNWQKNSILFLSEKVSTLDLPATIAEDQDVKEGDFSINFLLVSKMKCSHGTSFEQMNHG